MKQRQQVGAFVLDNDLEYPWWINVYVPDGKGGRHRVRFRAYFVHLSPDRRKQILEEYRDLVAEHRKAKDRDIEDDLVDAVEEIKTFQHHLLIEATRRIDKMLDTKGNKLDFTVDDPMFDQVLDNTWARQALAEHYMESLTSRKPEKNS